MVKDDEAFNRPGFVELVEKCDPTFESTPPRRRNKNVLESRNGSIWIIYLRIY